MILPTFGSQVSKSNVSAAPPFRPVPAAIEAPLAWSFAGREGLQLPGQSDVQERKFNAELIKGQAVIHATPEAALNSINVAKTALEEALARSPEWLRAGEQDIVDKLSLQRRHSSQWYFLPPEPPKMGPTRDYLEVARALALFYASKLERKSAYEWAILDNDPPETNSGWPLFANQLEYFLASLVALKVPRDGTDSWPGPTAWIKATEDLARMIGVPGNMFSAGVARRAGPTRKAVPLPFQLGSRSYSEGKGYYTRTRVVYMVSRLFNLAISPLSQQVKAARSRIFGFWHDGESRKKQLNWIRDVEKDMDIYESDFSAYDTSFTPEHRLAIYAALKTAGFQEQCLDLMAEAEQRWSVFTPLLEGPRQGEVAVASGRMGLLSGMKETSNLGSFHAQAMVLKSFIAQGLTTLEDVQKGKWPTFLNLGDDVLLAVPKSFSTDKYVASCAQEGIKVKCLPGRRMLMRHLHEGKEYSVAARLLQQTLGNEDSYVYTGHAVLGLAARLQVAPYPTLQSVVKKVLLSTVTGTMLPILQETDLDVGKLMVHPSVAEFLKSARGESWATDYLNLDSRPSVQELTAVLAANNFTPKAVVLDRAEQLRALFTVNKDHAAALQLLGDRISYA